MPKGPNKPEGWADCLILAGTVPMGYAKTPQSKEMGETEVWDQGAEVDEPTIVATDGGCSKTATGPRAGWGYASNNPRMGHGFGAAKGQAQTPQGARYWG